MSLECSNCERDVRAGCDCWDGEFVKVDMLAHFASIPVDGPEKPVEPRTDPHAYDEVDK